MVLLAATVAVAVRAVGSLLVASLVWCRRRRRAW